MKPDRILVMVKVKQLDLGETEIFMSMHFSYEVETRTLKSWFTRGATVHDLGSTVAQQTPVKVLSSDVDCYRFLELVGNYRKEGKLMDVQFRDGGTSV